MYQMQRGKDELLTASIIVSNYFWGTLTLTCCYIFVFPFLQVKQDNLSEICSCGGEYKTLIDAKQNTVKLKTYLAIAEHFRMPLLHHNIKWVLQMNPHLN